MSQQLHIFAVFTFPIAILDLSHLHPYIVQISEIIALSNIISD